MIDGFLIIVVVLIAIGGIAGVAYLLDKRGKNADQTPPKPGPIARVFWWIARILVVLMVLSIIGAIKNASIPLASLTGTLLGVYIFNGIIYRILLANGK